MNPTIGVVIVAQRRTEELDRALDSVRNQADDVSVRVNQTESLSEARNRATGSLDTDVYAFVDADARTESGWADALREGYAAGELAVGGPAVPPDDLQVPPAWAWLVGIGPLTDENVTEPKHIRNTYGCNFSVRADVFDALGGFDETLGKGAQIPHGEETDLAQRMHEEYGRRMLYHPDAVVTHYVNTGQLSRRALLSRAFEQAKTKAYLGVDDEEQSFLTDEYLPPSRFSLLLFPALVAGTISGTAHRFKQ